MHLGSRFNFALPSILGQGRSAPACIMRQMFYFDRRKHSLEEAGKRSPLVSDMRPVQSCTMILFLMKPSLCTPDQWTRRVRVRSSHLTRFRRFLERSMWCFGHCVRLVFYSRLRRSASEVSHRGGPRRSSYISAIALWEHRRSHDPGARHHDLCRSRMGNPAFCRHNCRRKSRLSKAPVERYRYDKAGTFQARIVLVRPGAVRRHAGGARRQSWTAANP